MIAYIEGKLFKKEEERILLLANQVGYEILTPAIVMESIKSKSVGDQISLYIYYHQTDRQPKPVLIGFTKELEKEFFLKFITVADIGPLKAVKAMNLPINEIAEAIESKDAAKLKGLKGIGARTAQKIIASLCGKLDKYVMGENINEAKGSSAISIGDFSQQVLDVLVEKFGHKASEAKQMIREAFARNKAVSTPEELFDEIFKSGRSV
ncbi:Holliday junction branch migration protein RuvA [Desulfobacterales bacterium HSG16]|nr:Holliday junction branch migration protein RuvA [Desulfobacterales bacterium HSG16]